MRRRKSRPVLHSSGLTRPARINSSRFHERITKRGSVIGPLNNWAHSEMPQDAHARYGRCPTQLPTIRPERAGRERGTETPWKGSHGNLCPVKLSECEAVKGLVKRPALVPQDANCHRFAKQQRTATHLIANALRPYRGPKRHCWQLCSAHRPP